MLTYLFCERGDGEVEVFSLYTVSAFIEENFIDPLKGKFSFSTSIQEKHTNKNNNRTKVNGALVAQPGNQRTFSSD